MVTRDHLARGLDIRIAQRRHRLRDLILHQAAHAQHDVVQIRELLVEAFECVLLGRHRMRFLTAPIRLAFSRIGR